MPAYVIIDMTVNDPALLEEYKRLSPATTEQHGGRFLARGGRIEALEGDWDPQRIVILEFPSVERASAWRHSPDYAPARAMRQRAAAARIVAVEGIGS